MSVFQIAAAAQPLDLSLIISVVALVLSILSPVLSAIIGGIFHWREKRLELKAEFERRNHEFYEQHKAKVIEQYINAVGRAVQISSDENRQAFGESMGEIYMYIDPIHWELLDSISGKIKGNNSASAIDDFRKLCKILQKSKVRSNALTEKKGLWARFRSRSFASDINLPPSV